MTVNSIHRTDSAFLHGLGRSRPPRMVVFFWPGESIN